MSEDHTYNISIHTYIYIYIYYIYIYIYIPSTAQRDKWAISLTLNNLRRLLFLFLTFSTWVPNPKNCVTNYTVVNPACGLLNREKSTKRESLAAHPLPPKLLVPNKTHDAYNKDNKQNRLSEGHHVMHLHA